MQVQELFGRPAYFLTFPSSKNSDSGICTCINVLQFEIPFSKKLFGRRLYIGNGLLSVMGTSFTFLPIFEIAIRQMKSDGIKGTDAYGKIQSHVIVYLC